MTRTLEGAVTTAHERLYDAESPWPDLIRPDPAIRARDVAWRIGYRVDARVKPAHDDVCLVLAMIQQPGAARRLATRPCACKP